MKRLTAIICVIVLCLSTALSLASTEIKDDISFRNIPWESSIDEVLATLKKEFGKNITYESEFIKTRVGNEYCYVIRYVFEIPELKVAGFPVGGEHSRIYTDPKSLELFFIPELDASQTSFSQEKGRLVGAKYPYIYSNEMNFSSLSAELEKKLDGLYGSAEELYADEGYWRRQWTKGDAYILGDTMEKSESIKQGILTITTYVPGGCSLFYAYFPESILAECEIITNVYQREQQEKREQEQKQREEQKEKEEQERGTDGL